MTPIFVTSWEEVEGILHRKDSLFLKELGQFGPDPFHILNRSEKAVSEMLGWGALHLLFLSFSKGVRDYFNISLFTGGTFDFILSWLQVYIVIVDRVITIRAPIRKFLDDLFFQFGPHISIFKLF
jgi:hypothetical protein